MKRRKGLARDVFESYNTFATQSGLNCLWRHWDRLPGTKWQHSWSCFHDFQTSNFNKQDQKFTEKLLCVYIKIKNKNLFFIPFLSIRPILLLWFGWPFELLQSIHEQAYIYISQQLLFFRRLLMGEFCFDSKRHALVLRLPLTALREPKNLFQWERADVN